MAADQLESTIGQRRKFIILDDDPTGTQTVADVGVILKPSARAYRRFMEGADTAVFVLTNTRAMHRNEAVALLETIKGDAEREAENCGVSVKFMLRGDSTLRGHVFAEMDVFSDQRSVGLFVPAFPECGRLTLDGIHYFDDGSVRRPVAETEFARDPVFGYKSSRLTDWVQEVGPGWKAETIPLEQIRTRGVDAVAFSLIHADPRMVVIPDAETEGDLEAIAEGLKMAEEAGKTVTVRSASSFVRIRCGLNSRMLAAQDVPPCRKLLIVCGSHTAASTRQLESLTGRFSLTPVVVPTRRLFEEDLSDVIDELQKAVIADLTAHGVALLTSERVRDESHGGLADGAKVMEALIGTVANASPYCDGVIAKGGITSAQVAADGLNAAYAEVCGQLEAGVSLWKLALPDRGAGLPYAVVPGNVGTDETICRVATLFGLHK